MCLGEGSNHSRVCPCLKKAYFEINHFRTPCSPHGEVARIPYHDHNSTTAETELKYLRTYGSIFTFLDTNKFSFTLVSSSSSLSTLVSHNLKRGQTSKKTKYFRPCTVRLSLDK